MYIMQFQLEELIMEADAGEDWRIDPVLREQCQPVVNLACRGVSNLFLHTIIDFNSVYNWNIYI